MRNARGVGIDPGRIIPILSVSPVEADHVQLDRILQAADWTPYTESKWLLRRAFTLESGLAELRRERLIAVVSADHLPPGSWKRMLAELLEMAESPLLILTSRLADESLWAEALNLGAHDVLAKPLQAQEVTRVLGWAWLHWNRGGASGCGQMVNRKTAAAA